MRALLLLAWALAAGLPASGLIGGESPLRIDEREQNGEFQVWGENKDPDAVRWAWIEMAANDNAWPDTGLPRGFVLRPYDRRLLFTVRARDAQRGFSYALRTRMGEGDPERDPDRDAAYLLPWAHGSKHTLGQGYFGRATHSGVHALDFDMGEGTPVHAARAGVVIKVKQDSDRGGMMRGDAEDGNLVQVLHDDATWAVYAHLQYNGVRVQKGQRVKAGELLGLSGSTGMASGPHLHFAVYRAAWDGPRSVPTLFQTGPEQRSSLEERRTYYAWHPGGAAFTPLLGEALKHSDYVGRTRSAKPGPFRIAQEQVDARTLVWGVNGGDQAIEAVVEMSGHGSRASVSLPHRASIPPRTEAYLFFVDFVDDGAEFRLKAYARPLPKPR